MTGTTQTVDEAPADAIEVTTGGGKVRFEPDEFTVPAGTVKFFIRNEGTGSVGDPSHNLQIGEDLPPTPALVGSLPVRPNLKALFTVDGLEPGSYRIWCSVSETGLGSHFAAGMVGTLTVTP